MKGGSEAARVTVDINKEQFSSHNTILMTFTWYIRS